MLILGLFEVHPGRYPTSVIRLEQSMRRLPQGEPILIFGPLSLVLSDFGRRKVIRTFFGQTQLLPILEELDQTVADGEDAISIRIGAERE